MIIAGSSLRITISVGEDIGAGTAVIKFKSPSSQGVWTAVVDDASTGTIHYDAIPSDIAVVGTWAVWAVYTLADARVWKTAAKQFTVYEEGTVQR